MCAASAINQYRIHAGYHYPRSAETVSEILEAREEFINAFRPAIVSNSRNYYAIPRCGSRTSPQCYEQLMAGYGLPLLRCRPDWLNYEFIHTCYEVDEHLYDATLLRSLISERLAATGVRFEQRSFDTEMRTGYDFVVWATYGMAPNIRSPRKCLSNCPKPCIT
jgi:hypothetical protein